MKTEQNLNNAETQALTIPVVGKRYFHELSQDEVDKLITDKNNWGDIMREYKQPDWCKYPNALEGSMGCWSLVDLSKDGWRYETAGIKCGTLSADHE